MGAAMPGLFDRLHQIRKEGHERLDPLWDKAGPRVDGIEGLLGGIPFRQHDLNLFTPQIILRKDIQHIDESGSAGRAT